LPPCNDGEIDGSAADDPMHAVFFSGNCRGTAKPRLAKKFGRSPALPEGPAGWRAQAAARWQLRHRDDLLERDHAKSICVHASVRHSRLHVPHVIIACPGIRRHARQHEGGPDGRASRVNDVESGTCLASRGRRTRCLASRSRRTRSPRIARSRRRHRRRPEDVNQIKQEKHSTASGHLRFEAQNQTLQRIDTSNFKIFWGIL